MVNRERVREEPAHDVVLGKLLDIQARLRGEPASAVPATRPIAVDLPETVTVVHGDMHILSDRPRDVAEAHIAELKARLAQLESMIEEAGLQPDDAGDTDDPTVTSVSGPTEASDAGSDEDRPADP
jgi:hypothetical protein